MEFSADEDVDAVGDADVWVDLPFGSCWPPKEARNFLESLAEGPACRSDNTKS